MAAEAKPVQVGECAGCSSVKLAHCACAWCGIKANKPGSLRDAKVGASS
jgi:ribosomal protein L32